MEIIGIILIVVVVLILVAYFKWSKLEKVADSNERGSQTITIVVSGAYSPNVVHVKAGKPLTLIFDRQEDSSCSKKVIFSDFGITADLADFDRTEIKFTPDKIGEFNFTCEMGMYQGKLIVEE